MSLTYHHSERGFSLVESSALVVILGLGVAATMAGADLLKTAQLRQLISESKDYAWHMETFEAFYEGLPGDLKTAANFWPQSMPGDGNGFVESEAGESYRVWQHLSLTRLIEGTYDGKSQLPQSPLEDGIAYRIEKQPSKVYLTGANTRNGVHLRSTGGWHGAISPIDAQVIDKKMDDGVASRGRLVAYSDNENGCTKTESGANAPIDYSGVAQYNTENDAPLCAMTYWVAAK